MSRLRVDNLRYRQWGPIDLVVDAGQCAAVTGRSGSGKTLLLRAMVDLDPHSGSVSIDATESRTVAAPVWRRRLGMLPAESRWWHDSVGEHFATPPVDMLAELGFDTDVLAWRIDRLSTGERQRLALARLLTNGPDALLLDEPTASLDPASAAAAEALVASYRADHDVPVVWVSHDAEQALRVATASYELTGGKLVRQR